MTEQEEKLKDLKITGPTVYVCEVTGSDEAGKGTAEAPFKTAIRALFHDPTCTILIRKSLEGDEAGFNEIAKAAYKKAKKGYDTQKQKLEKEEIRKQEEAKMSALKAEEDRKRLEEAAKIKLTRDDSWPKAKSVIR
jgi:asparaginyl-tRNA synthetase